MNRSILQLLVTFIVAVVLIPGIAGCSHQPTQADFDKINNDRTLTVEQKTDRLIALRPDPNAQYFQVSGALAFVAVALAVIVSIAKRRESDGSSSPQKSKSPSLHPKPANHSQPARPTPAARPNAQTKKD